MSTGFLKLNVAIETLEGNRSKYEVDHETGWTQLDRMLFISMRYPGGCGSTDDSLGSDGDPLNVLALPEEPIFPGCVIICRTLGTFRASSEYGGNDRALCMPTGDQRASRCTELEDVSEFRRLEIQHFSEVYKDLGPGKSAGGADWVGRAETEKEILTSLACFREEKGPDTHTYIYRQGPPGCRQDSPEFMRYHS